MSIKSNTTTETGKTQMSFLQAHSLRDLLMQVNSYNLNNSECPILKEDIVEILKEEDTFILIYYKV